MNAIPNGKHNLLSALDEIITGSVSLVRCFVSSRDDGDITSMLGDYPNTSIIASDNSKNISNYVNADVSKAIEKKRIIRGKVSPAMKQKIIDTHINGAQGM